MNSKSALLDGVPSRAAITDTFARHISPGKVAFFQRAGIDFVMGRREGPYLWDIEGQVRLIDCHCNGGVFNLGHRNEEISAALVDSLHSWDIGNHHLISQQRALLAEQLARLTPGNLQYSVLGVAGGEAIDLALKVARAFKGRPKIISVQGAYHGCTGLALAAGDAKFRLGFGQAFPGFVQVPWGNLELLRQNLDEHTAAVIVETVPATYGIAVPEPSYLPAIREACDECGTLLIVDEVQAGLGRTGRLWGIEHFGVLPDILVTGKGLSGGIYPMAATCFRAELQSVFDPDPFIHISTFGGAEVGCAVASRVLAISSEPAFLWHVGEIAGMFRDGFAQLQGRHPEVLVRLRQLGMMMGIEMRHPAHGPLFSKAAFDHGLLSVYAANDTRVAQFLPPLTIDRGLATEILERVDRALGQVATMAARQPR